MAQENNTPPDSITDIETLITISRACQSAVTGSPPAETFDLIDLLLAGNRCLQFAQAHPESRVKYLTGGLACEAVSKGITLNQSHFVAASREFWMDTLDQEAKII